MVSHDFVMKTRTPVPWSHFGNVGIYGLISTTAVMRRLGLSEAVSQPVKREILNIMRLHSGPAPKALRNEGKFTLAMQPVCQSWDAGWEARAVDLHRPLCPPRLLVPAVCMRQTSFKPAEKSCFWHLPA